MGDRKLRALERGSRVGDRQSEATYLWERVRLGTLSNDRYRLAHALGAPALGGAEHPPLGFQQWIEALPFRRRGERVERDWARVPLAIAEALAPCASELDVTLRLATLRLAARRSLERDRRARLTDYRDAQDLVQRTPWSHRAVSKFVALAFEELLYRQGHRHGYERLARSLLYPPAWTELEALVEGVFPSQDGRLWGLRLAVRDALLPWALRDRPA